MMPETTIRWSELKARLEQLLSQARAKMDDAVGEELFKLQGEARSLKRLLNLPESLALIESEDRRVLKEKLEKANERN